MIEEKDEINQNTEEVNDEVVDSSTPFNTDDNAESTDAINTNTYHNYVEKQAPYVSGDKDRSGIEFNSDADTSINSAALANQEISSDEESLIDAMGTNPFKLFCIRTFIKVKNHISIIPMILTVVSMMLLSIPIHSHIEAMNKLARDTYNSFYLFADLILAILSILAYINVNSKKSSKAKKIGMSVFFYIVMAIQIYIAFYFLYDINIETKVLFNDNNKVVDSDGVIAKSRSLFLVHAIFCIITVVLAALEPLLQPVCKKIKIKRKKKNDSTLTDDLMLDENEVSSTVDNVETTCDVDTTNIDTNYTDSTNLESNNSDAI